MGKELSTTKKRKKPARWTRDSNPGRPMYCEPWNDFRSTRR